MHHNTCLTWLGQEMMWHTNKFPSVSISRYFMPFAMRSFFCCPSWGPDLCHLFFVLFGRELLWTCRFYISYWSVVNILIWRQLLMQETFTKEKFFYWACIENSIFWECRLLIWQPFQDEIESRKSLLPLMSQCFNTFFSLQSCLFIFEGSDGWYFSPVIKYYSTKDGYVFRYQ